MNGIVHLSLVTTPGAACPEALSRTPDRLPSVRRQGRDSVLVRRCARLAIFLGLAIIGNVAFAQQAHEIARQISTQGNSRGAPACATCHGAKGEGMAAFPRIAGTGQIYLLEQLDAFAAGTRKSTTMQTIAKNLSDPERTALAAYYSKLPAPSVSLPTAEPVPGDVGAWLANRGRWDDNLPACVQCHGPGGRGVGQNFPPLAGLSTDYILAQLQAWRTDDRPPGPLGLMKTIASKLSAADSKAVAEYYSGQTPTIAATLKAVPAPVKGERP